MKPKMTLEEHREFALLIRKTHAALREIDIKISEAYGVSCHAAQATERSVRHFGEARSRIDDLFCASYKEHSPYYGEQDESA